MQQLKDWFEVKRAAIVSRFAGDDPRKAARLNAAALLAAGFILGTLATLANRLIGILAVMAVSGAIGYAARSFVSYRRRAAFRRSKF